MRTGEPFEKLWQSKVFDLLLKRGKIDESFVTQMMGWQHSGFGVNFAVRLGAGDLAGRERLAQYMLRCPFSLDRMIRVTDEGKVLYLAEKKTPRRFPKPASGDLLGHVARNFQVFDPLDFIAELTQHIPDTRRHLTRYFGWYCCKARGLRAKANADQGNVVEIDDHRTPRPHLARRRWAALIKRVWNVDPLECPRCHGRLQIISFIQPPQHDVIESILRHCGLWENSSCAPPPDDRGPGREQGLGEIRYVSDLQFVDEPAPSEPVWIAD